ncbi:MULTISPECIES: hypothetical protein [unclassified Methanoregula]|uniref:hypothetical protein n=1 Tax=unclassified Methanoregula TaxID=2649730 RepID=UPI0009C6E293|nr:MULTISPECIES: hypothetical protein [unclassified Methanoregula]OPX61728.1 MAG: hypothetical protein A4E33_02830 [Methanoregula sp. PtaB.Bin085]OPY33963.1 MAG: hypothetical protein A4E34_01548 [Methanoregula sp. PtaU1.Bin006]
MVNTTPMAGSWKEARELAVKDGLPMMYHDFDDGVFGASRQGESQGVFKNEVFTEHRCICMPSHLTAEDPEA